MKKVCLVGTLLGTVCLALAIANVAGWRARIVARVFRVDNDPVVVALPPAFLPRVPSGFQASVLTREDGPRWLALSPNGDLFVADSGAGSVVVLRARPDWTDVQSRHVFATRLPQPFGIAFRGDYAYVANTNEVVRYRYDPGTSTRLSDAQHVDLPGLGYNQHWTRSLAFAADGSVLYVSVGSKHNIAIESDVRRAAVLACDPDGRNARVYASGLRNAVGIGVNPSDGRLWATVNERDDLGDDVPRDYFTHVVDGGFYGWPYSYLGAHVDSRVSSRPDMVARAIVPDVLLGPHVAPLQFAFYEGTQFPGHYRHGAFIAEHGSWNRRLRSGYDVAFIPFADGQPSGPPEPFLSGLVPDAAGKDVYGRPVGVVVAPDGSLLISDDGANVIWRVSYPG